MKFLTKIATSVLLLGVLITACTSDFEKTNKNPNDPTSVPTTTLMINAQKRLVEDIRDEWFSGRMALLWAQYWAQVNYTEEDRYQYRENSNNTAWKTIYTDLMDLQRIIELNTDDATKDQMAAYGSNANQIAAARILKSWTFELLTDTYGPIPYQSYGSDDPDFQALQARSGDILSPTYAAQDKIYKDILKELREAADMIDVSKPAFTEGDNLFAGDAAKWKRFANSLILRVAMRMRNVDPTTANAAIDAAIASGVMTSNDDNAIFVHETVTANASPMYNAYLSRTDFAVTKNLIDLLKGDIGPFGITDPRMYIYAAPYTTKKSDILAGIIPQADDSLYRGQPYGVENHVASALGIGYASLPNAPIQATFGETFMDYAETCFLLSEYNNWDQTWYLKGITASMQRWGVPEAEIATYVANVPAANEENVLTQKYIALYMQPYNAWAEYRRTGYPHTLLKPGDVSFVDTNGIVDPENPGASYRFQSLVEDVQSDLPARVKFSQEEQLLNPDGYAKGKELLGGPDLMSTKLWWDVN